MGKNRKKKTPTKSDRQMYAQCTYERKMPGGGIQKDTSWIPRELAKVGKKIYFGEKRDSVDTTDLWTVTEVGAIRPLALLIEKRNADQRQRETSDI